MGHKTQADKADRLPHTHTHTHANDENIHTCPYHLISVTNHMNLVNLRRRVFNFFKK